MNRTSVLEIFHCVTDLTTSLINDSYTIFQVISNPQYQQRRINEVKAITTTVVGFALTLWFIWQEVAARIVDNALVSPEPDITTTTQQVTRAITQAFIADINTCITTTLSTLMPAVVTAAHHNAAVTQLGSFHLVEINA
jgi:hypothetical protein